MTTIGAPNQTIAAEPIVKNNVQPATNPADIQVPPPAPKEDGGNKLMNALTGLAMIGAGTMLLYNLRKGRGIDAKTLEAFKAQGGKFEKGIAKLADGSNFTGIIHAVPRLSDRGRAGHGQASSGKGDLRRRLLCRLSAL